MEVTKSIQGSTYLNSGRDFFGDQLLSGGGGCSLCLWRHFVGFLPKLSSRDALRTRCVFFFCRRWWGHKIHPGKHLSELWKRSLRDSFGDQLLSGGRRGVWPLFVASFCRFSPQLPRLPWAKKTYKTSPFCGGNATFRGCGVGGGGCYRGGSPHRKIGNFLRSGTKENRLAKSLTKKRARDAPEV